MHDPVKDPDRLEQNPDWRHLLILVHGFNNPESEAEEKYGRYIEMLRPLLERSRVAPDAVAKFHWPGNEVVWKNVALFDFAGYPTDLKRARDSVKPFAELLRRLLRDGPPTRVISIVGHSLGCRVITQTMRRLRENPPSALLGTVTLMAAAVPVELARPGAQPPDASLEIAPAAATKMLIAYSRRDLVLDYAFPRGQRDAAKERAAEYSDEAVGLNGNPPRYGEPLCRENNGHGAYWTDKDTVNAMLGAMDATLRSLPPEAAIAPNDLPPAGEIPARSVASRRLPS